MKILITGGGSGGHLSPALATIEELRKLAREKNFPLDLLFVGGKMGMEGTKGPSIEQRVLATTDIPCVFISSGKLQRVFSLSSLWSLRGVIPGFFQGLYYLFKFKPNVVFSTGGFVSVPVVLASSFFRIPLVIHEQTAAVGLSNKIASFFAKKIAISFAVSEKEFPPEKIILTGNPIRSKIVLAGRRRLEHLKKDQGNQDKYPLIYITAGALGSHLINEAVGAILPGLLEKYEVVHQTGSNEKYQDLAILSKKKETLPKTLAERYHLYSYLDEDQLAQVLERTQFVISRAGANTVNELAALAIPAILIPIPWVTHNEQYKNGRILVNAGSGKIIDESKLNPERLLAEVKSFGQLDQLLISQKNALELMKEIKVDGAVHLADIILSFAS